MRGGCQFSTYQFGALFPEVGQVFTVTLSGGNLALEIGHLGLQAFHFILEQRHVSVLLVLELWF